MAINKGQVILITGAASGLGRCFAEHYLSQINIHVIAVDIAPITFEGRTRGEGSTLTALKADFSSTLSIEALVQSLRAENISAIDLVIHSAGIRGLVPTIVDQKPDDVAAAETLQVMNPETMMKTYQINTMGTFTLLQHLHKNDLLRAATSTCGPSLVVIMTSRMGSVSYNTTGGAYAYRASKAALNAIVRSMAIDIPGVVFALLHPGRVETGLTRCREAGAIEAEESVRDMLSVINGLSITDSGRFMDRFGIDIGW